MADLARGAEVEPDGGPRAAHDAVAPLPTAKEPPALAAKADDLDSLRAAVIDAAAVGGGLWLSYLFVLFYLLVAAGAVTPIDLFLENPVKLPFLNIDLPLKGFFWLGPALFLIVHAYVLLHFVMLAGKIVVFDRALRAQIDDREVRTKLRRQLPSNIFVQFLAGPTEIRDGVMGISLWIIALITLVIGPVLLLVFFDLQFLPYHNEAITWWQRIAVGIDLVLLWLFWPSIALRNMDAGESDHSHFRVVLAIQRLCTIGIMLILTLGSPPLLLLIATFPGEGLEQALRTLGTIPFRAWLVEGAVNPATRRPESLFSNRLVVPGFDRIDQSKLESESKINALLGTSFSLRSRHLEGAVLTDAKLRKADLSGAFLRGAFLDRADLREANLGCASYLMNDPKTGKGERNPICTQLQGASLYRAQLQGASLDGAQLQGAVLAWAELQGASLDGAAAQGTWLFNAKLQGASLNHAQFQGADLASAELQGASLDDVEFQGADLDSAYLQGASLDRAQLQGASMRWAFVWRVTVTSADLARTRVEDVTPDRKEWCDDLSKYFHCDWTTETFLRVREAATRVIPEGPMRDLALARIDKSLNPSVSVPGEADMAGRWQEPASQFSQATFEAAVAKTWVEIGCAPDGAPYVMQALIRTLQPSVRSPFAQGSSHPSELASAFLAETCEGRRGLSPDDMDTLRHLRAPIPSTSKSP